MHHHHGDPFGIMRWYQQWYNTDYTK